jgi:hypothetical protein
MNLYICPECGYTGISGVSGGVGPWLGDGKVRCPSSRCEYRTVMEEKGALVSPAENEALQTSLDDWMTRATDNAALLDIVAEQRDQMREALKAVWGDMRGVDKHHVPAEVVALVAEAIGGDLDEHDPAYRSVETEEGQR